MTEVDGEDNTSGRIGLPKACHKGAAKQTKTSGKEGQSLGGENNPPQPFIAKKARDHDNRRHPIGSSEKQNEGESE